MRIHVTKQIAAPPERVFDVISDMEKYSQVMPHITNVEFLTEQKIGRGTRFRETRTVGGKEETSDFEVLEFVPNQQIRIVTEAGGSTWDSTFTVQPVAGGSELQLAMDAITDRFATKVMHQCIKFLIKRSIKGEFEMLKSHCEGNP